MTERDDIVRAIAHTLKEAYGDASLTPLDYEAARKVYDCITEMGMVPLSTLAAVIAAAGGRVAISEDLLMDAPGEVMRIDDPVERTMVLKVKVPAVGAST